MIQAIAVVRKRDHAESRGVGARLLPDPPPNGESERSERTIEAISVPQHR